jgi:phage terminase large subunit GpA-like protein
VIWSEAERRAWKWPATLKPSEWAQQNRILPGHVTVEPGPWRNERTPYLVGIMDAISEKGIEGVVVLKAAQVGFSEALRNLLGFWIDHEPGPALVVMPDNKSGGELIEERIKPLLEFTPAVARHVTSRMWDVTKSAVKLDTMSIYIGSAYSSQSLKSRPIRYLLLEEPDEYPAVSGAAGEPISKALKRITTYSAKGKARVILGGTPTTRMKATWKHWEICGEKRHFWVPCPHCGHFQQLIWGERGDGPGVKWQKIADEPDRSKQAARIEADDLAWYQCGNPECSKRILDAHKLAMIQRGVWASEDQAVTADGRVVGPEPKRTKWVGFHLPAMYSPWVSFAKLAAEWLNAQGDHQQLADFINQRLAEPYEEVSAKLTISDVEDKVKYAPPPLVAPPWTQAIFLTADSQQDHFVFAIRAWGFGEKSQLLHNGIVSTLDGPLGLHEMAFGKAFPVEGGGFMNCYAILIDRQSREEDVDNFALSDPARIIPIFGSHLEWTGWPVKDKAHHKVSGIRIWELETVQLKNMLNRLIKDPDPTKWMPHNQVNHDYCAQMSSEERIFDPKKKRMVWKKRRANHFWDCEVYQCAAAKQALMGLMANSAPQKTTAPARRVTVKRPDFLPNSTS